MVVREQADILDADTIGDGHQLAHLWCRLAPIEPFCKDNPVLIVIAERAIEVVDGGVVSSDHQLQFLNIARPQPILRCAHDGPTKAAETMIRIDSYVVDPAAVAVMPDQYRGDKCAVVA